MWGDIAIAFILAFITSFVVVPYTIKLAHKVGAIDVPKDERRMNSKPIPRIGGIAVIVGFLVASTFLIVTSLIENKINATDFEYYKFRILGFLGGIAIIAIAAYLDDIKNLKPIIKLIAQVAAAALIYAVGIKIDYIGSWELPVWFSCILTMGWIVGITNAINLIDGLDGLSSGISLISCLELLIIFATNDSPVIAVILITALAGAISGFLPYNINPAKTFIGDVGAQFLGFSLAVIAILGVAKTVTLIVMIAPILILGLPILDTVFAILRRMIKNKSIKAVFQADNGHLHHKLIQRGYNQKQAVTILYAASAALGMSAIIFIEDAWWKGVAFIVLTLLVILAGHKEFIKYNKKLIEENIELGLVDEKKIDQKKLEKIKSNKEKENKED